MNEVTNALNRIMKGSIIILVGSQIGVIFGFLGKIVLVRIITPSDIGIFSLAIVITNFLATISYIGMTEGIPRYIGFNRGNPKKIRGIIFSSISVTLLTSLTLSLLLFFFSGWIATAVFNKPELSFALKIASLGLVFYVEFNILISIFRGLSRADIKFYFNDILRNLFYLIGLILIYFLARSLTGVLSNYIFSFFLVFVILGIYSIKKLELFGEKKLVTKELVGFSSPLMVANFFHFFMLWTDILMVGYYLSSPSVGIYNIGATTLSRMIPLFFASAQFLYMPIISELYSKNLKREYKRTYQIMTKWVSGITFSTFLAVFLFSTPIISSLFGRDYTLASNTLRILSIGLLIHVFLGPNGINLTVIGKTKFLMYLTFLAASTNLFLNYLLIPKFGIEGAAMGTTIAYIILSIGKLLKFYSIEKIHPFYGNFLKPLSLTALLSLISYYCCRNIEISLSFALFFFILFVFFYIFSMYVTKSLEEEDSAVIKYIKDRIVTKFNLNRFS